jgi:hypothetical protein
VDHPVQANENFVCRVTPTEGETVHVPPDGAPLIAIATDALETGLVEPIESRPRSNLEATLAVEVSVSANVYLNPPIKAPGFNTSSGDEGDDNNTGEPASKLRRLGVGALVLPRASTLICIHLVVYNTPVLDTGVSVAASATWSFEVMAT